jgi:serine/threonine protein kinase
MMSDFVSAENDVVRDQFGNHHRLAGEISRGGQGAVYRTTDPDIAVKLTFEANQVVRRKISNIRCLPFPDNVQVSLPLAVLKDRGGYVMRLLDGMESFRCFDLTGDKRAIVSKQETPVWLSGVDEYTRDLLLHYANSGSTRRRLEVLSRVAGILARLHSRGIVYGDISPNNCFVGERESDDVWLIDPDNLRLETVDNAGSTYTPRYGAPEVVSGEDSVRPRTDSWSFAVMAFELIHLIHPFLGAAVEANNDDTGWDTTTSHNSADVYELAFAGKLPFIDDENDRSNEKPYLLPRDLVLTPSLTMLFQNTLGIGRLSPWRRFVMDLWALELARAHDALLNCESCKMSFRHSETKCPYCGHPRGSYAVIETNYWTYVIQKDDSNVSLPHRLFHPFSLEFQHVESTRLQIDFETERVDVDPDSDPPQGPYELIFVRSAE